MDKPADQGQTPEQIAEELTGCTPPLVQSPFVAPPRVSAPSPERATAVSSPGNDIDPLKLPTNLNQLTAAFNRSYDLTLTRAADLSIPVVGSVGGGMNRRVVVLERIAYRPLVGTSGTEYHFGYAIRLCVTVNKWDANMKVSLPFLAASAQMGQVEASWMLQVLGLAGKKVSEVAAPPTELNVETFVLAKQSLTALIAAVNDTSTNFEAYQLATLVPEQKRDEELRRGAAKTYALSRIARRSSLQDALNRIGSDDVVINSSIEDVYNAIADGSPASRPSEAAARKSRELLGSVEADT